MTQPRSSLISLDTTPYYHCISRCVRRAFLYGDDHYSGQNFNHRKPWFIDRLKLLTEAFAIDLAAFSIMSNHYHLALHVDKPRSQTWSDDTVIQHWLTLYKGPKLVHQYLSGDIQTTHEQTLLQKKIEIWRERLSNISWFMKCLNEYIARKANKEDNCTGRFWEGRFKSQALLDESSLLSCMTYIDLNPIRAGICHDLESSEYTSIKQRIEQVKNNMAEKTTLRLMPFSETIKQKQDFAAIPFQLKAYIELVDWTGRCVRNDKPGYIKGDKPILISTLGLSEAQWQYLALEIQKQSICILNGLDRLTTLEKRQKNNLAT